MVKILSIFVAFLENMNFTNLKEIKSGEMNFIYSWFNIVALISLTFFGVSLTYRVFLTFGLIISSRSETFFVCWQLDYFFGSWSNFDTYQSVK